MYSRGGSYMKERKDREGTLLTFLLILSLYLHNILPFLFLGKEQYDGKKSMSRCRDDGEVLTCLRTHCSFCGRPIPVAYRTQRTITTLQGSCRLILRVRRCRNPVCEWYHRPCRPEEEGKWALPHGEFGLDVIALVGTLRYTAHRSIPEIHQALRDRG